MKNEMAVSQHHELDIAQSVVINGISEQLDALLEFLGGNVQLAWRGGWQFLASGRKCDEKCAGERDPAEPVKIHEIAFGDQEEL